MADNAEPPIKEPHPRAVSVLFVCLGNICRSTMAEGVFRDLTSFGTPQQHPLIAAIDSCGTGAYHIGDQPNLHTLSVLADNRITSYTHKARKIKVPEDFTRFDYILAMDKDNVADLEEMAKWGKKRGDLYGDEVQRVHLYGKFGVQEPDEEVEDPYGGGRHGFETAYEQVTRLADGLLRHIEQQARDESETNG